MNLATADSHNRPAVTRAYGCRVDTVSNNLTVFVSSMNNQIIFDNIRANGAIAVVFSRPTTHQTLQFKGTNAEVVAIEVSDLELIRDYRESMVEELQGIGFPLAFIHSLVPSIEGIDTAIRFTPENAFSQTPGPQAGKKISHE